MMRWIPSTSALLATLALGLPCASLFADSPTGEFSSFEARLENGLKLLPTFTYDQDPAALAELETAILQSAHEPAKRARSEEGLLQALDSSTRAGSEIICRLLRTVASDRSVPPLESLLVDSKRSHLARYVLERMASPTAGDALRRALAKTTGQLRAGLLNTVARRGDTAAVPTAIADLKSSDDLVANAAASALGQLGGDASVEALHVARTDADTPLRRTIDEALLLCAERFVTTGRVSAAADIYDHFQNSDRPPHHRLAALRGILAIDRIAAIEQVLDAIEGDDATFRATAIQLTADIEGENLTRALTWLLPSIDETSQSLLIDSLAKRGGSIAKAAIVAATRSEDETVRAAAYTALGQVGDVSTVDLLVDAAAGVSKPEKQAARAALVELSGNGINERLAHDLGSYGAASKVERIRALTLRRSFSSLGHFLQVAWDTDARVRQQAIEALGRLASPAQLPTLIALLVSPQSPADRQQIAAAIRNVFYETSSIKTRAAPILAAFETSSSGAKAALIRLLGHAATEEARAAVLRAARRDAGEVRRAAVETLARWPNTTPTNDLLDLAKRLHDRNNRSIALRGYFSMASQADDASLLYARALEIAKNAADTQLVVESLAAVHSAETLEIAERFLNSDNVDLRDTAGRSVVKIAGSLQDQDAPRVMVAMQRTMDKVGDATIRQSAQEVLNHFERFDGYVLEWAYSGPYNERGKESPEIFSAKYLPETVDAKDVYWKPLRRGVGTWAIDLETGIARMNHCAAYVFTRVHSPVNQEARLEMGADDMLKAWVNREPVYGAWRRSGLRPRDVVATIQLKKGWNDLLLKVVDHGGGWQFCCRIRKPDGTVLDGLKVQRPRA